MGEQQFHSTLVWVVFGMAALTFTSLRFFAAPYGRHYTGRGWGPHVPNRIGWVAMELPSPLLFLYVYFSGSAAFRAAPLVLLGLWQCHYLNRTFLYSLRTRTAGRRIPVLVIGSGFAFNVVNAYVNARFVSEFGDYGPEWLADPRFLVGLSVFLAGLILNIHSDNILLGLRKPGETGYAIPEGGAYRYVSCPNYLGEIVEWAGWALATWALPGLAFFVYTAANLVPRALSHDQWYRTRFGDYPARRKAILPGLI